MPPILAPRPAPQPLYVYTSSAGPFAPARQSRRLSSEERRPLRGVRFVVEAGRPFRAVQARTLGRTSFMKASDAAGVCPRARSRHRKPFWEFGPPRVTCIPW